MTQNNKPYYYIRAWGKWLGSFPYYINDVILRARKENAPDNAIESRDDGSWFTIDDVLGSDVREHVETIAQQLRKEDTHE